MPDELVRVETADGIAVLYLDRPPVNAIDLQLLRRADEVVAGLAADEGVRALVVTGTGSCFSAGLDLKLVPHYSPEDQRRTMEGINRLVARLYALPIPVVAAVNGHAIAGGLVLALACDHRLGTQESCQLGLTEARAGVPFPAVAMNVVRAELAPAIARRLTLMARNYGPAEAQADGVLDELAPRATLVARAQAMAADLGAAPRTAYARIKHQLRAAVIESNAEVLAHGDPLVDAWLSADTGAASASLLRGE